MREKGLLHLALFLILILDIYFILGPLLQTDLLPGPDSPFYFYYASELVKTGQPGSLPFRDRVLTVLEPAIISQVLGVSPLWGIRIFLVSVSLTMLLGLYLLGRYLGGETLGVLVAMIALLSGSFSRLFWDLYANAFALSLIPFIVYFLFSGSQLEVKKFFLAGACAGSLFLVHNLTSFGFAIVIFPLFLLAIFWSDIRLKKWFKIFSCGGVFYLAVFLFGSGFLIPFLSVFLGFSGNGIFVPYQPTMFGEEGEMALIRPLFGLTSKRLFLPAVAGFLMAFWFLIRKKEKKFLPVFIWTGGLLILILQRLFGFNWEPERFTLIAFQPMVIFVAIFVVFLPQIFLIRKLMGLNKYLWQVGFAGIIFFFFWARLPTLGEGAVFGLPLATNQTERKIAQHLNLKLTTQDAVLINGIRFYWMRSFLSNTNVVWGEYYIICGNEQIISHYDSNNVWTARIFSGNLGEEEVRKEILKIKESKKFGKIFLFTFEGDKCGNGKQFANFKFLEKLIEEDGYKVYKFREDF